MEDHAKKSCDTPARCHSRCGCVFTVKGRAIVISCILAIVPYVGDAAPYGSCRLDVIQICVAQSREECRVVLQCILIQPVYTTYMHPLHCRGGLPQLSMLFRSRFHSRPRSHPSAGGRNGCCIAVEHGIARLVGLGDLNILEHG